MTMFSYLGSFVSIPIDVFGLYLIYFKTPRGMKTLKWTIFNAHFWGFLSDVLIGSLTIPYLFVPLIMGFPLGLLSILGISPVIQVYAAFSCVAEQSKKRGAKKFPCVTQEFYRDDNFVLVVNTALVSIPLSITLAYFILQIFVFFLQCLCQLFKASAVSARTRSLQRQYFLSVCTQILVPVITICSPVIYFIFAIQFDYYNQSINNICCIVISMYGCISTIGTIIIYEPYRLFTLNRIFGQQMKPSRNLIQDSGKSVIVLE
ncbi:unnamed protein product [Caenorhabditis angaria]|uniref:Serpentine Receptor, class H n=1 Tax=Caenorhabditis angaria TaxID=860376 RepID=A0A9P1IWW2_9PELO|nr:unnamed protein product [Caenorhabditis angaria]